MKSKGLVALGTVRSRARATVRRGAAAAARAGECAGAVGPGAARPGTRRSSRDVTRAARARGRGPGGNRGGGQRAGSSRRRGASAATTSRRRGGREWTLVWQQAVDGDAVVAADDSGQ